MTDFKSPPDPAWQPRNDQIPPPYFHADPLSGNLYGQPYVFQNQPLGFSPAPGKGAAKRTPLIVGGAIIAAIVIAGVVIGAAVSGPSAFTVNGTYTIDDGYSSCSADYPDVSSGTEIDITGADGMVIAVGNLAGSDCSYTFTVPNVPSGQTLYGVTTSSNRRGTLHFTEDQLRSGVSISLGR